jgi:hypothetical protein
MRRYVLSFLAALAIISAAGIGIADNKDVPPAIVWEKNLEDAIAKARTTGKSILLDFFVPT